MKSMINSKDKCRRNLVCLHPYDAFLKKSATGCQRSLNFFKLFSVKIGLEDGPRFQF